MAGSGTGMGSLFRSQSGEDRTRYTMRSLNRYDGRSGGVCSVASPASMGITCGGVGLLMNRQLVCACHETRSPC